MTKTLSRMALLAAGIFTMSNASAALEQFNPSAITASRSGYWIGAYSFGPDPSGDIALLKYDNNGALVFAKPYGPTQGFKDSVFYGFLPLRDGGAIVIGQSDTPSAYSLHRVDSAGTPVWSLSGLTSSHHSSDNFETQGTVVFGADNSGAVWFPANGHIYRVNATGALADFGQINLSTDDRYTGAVDPVSGALYFIMPAGSNVLTPDQLVRYTPTGGKTVLWTAPDSTTRLQFLDVGSDGNVYAVGNNTSTHIAMSFAPSGSVRWSKTFGSALYGFSIDDDAATQVTAAADGSIVAMDISGALFRIGTTGQVQQIPNDAYEHGLIDGDTLVQTTQQGDMLLSRLGEPILWLSATGQMLTQIGVSSYNGSPTILADGTILVMLTTPGGIGIYHYDRTGHQLNSSPSLVASLDPPALTRLDQIGFDGAWFASAESGQGFTIDYIPANNVLFLPWFTYNPDPTGDASGLAWVTFQGSPTPGATSATLSIARTQPGTFNSGIVSSAIIGTATFTATDCSTAYLQYQFDAADFGGLGGYMPLVRIGPSTTPCIGAGGKTTPAQTADATVQGFDANQSGSWFDPSTSGQGIEFTIIPPTTSLPAGLVFGAWFTFDAPPADDPQHQHWFTLQGSVASALNGTVTLPIQQTLGGSMDSLPAAGTTQVGTVTLSMLSCTTATMAYHFDNSAAAKTFAGLSGTINLSKIGGCVAP